MRKYGEEMIRSSLKFIFPDGLYCFSCDSLIDDSRPYGICDKCMEKFHWANQRLCEKCGKIMEEESLFQECKDCRNSQRFFKQGFTCLMYGLNEREIIKKFKYGGASYMKDKLGDLLYDRLKAEMDGPLRNIKIDCIIPVPIHGKRLKKRGYNQALLLGQRLSELSGIPVFPKVLKRKINTPPLSSMSREKRIVSIDEAFNVVNIEDQCIIDKTVLLVDDIFTTGVTGDECSRILLREGAREIFVLTLMAGGSS